MALGSIRLTDGSWGSTGGNRRRLAGDRQQLLVGRRSAEVRVYRRPTIFFFFALRASPGAVRGLSDDILWRSVKERLVCFCLKAVPVAAGEPCWLTCCCHQHLLRSVPLTF